MEEKDWHTMKVGEKAHPDNKTTIERVPGGWLFMNLQNICFIPLSRKSNY